MTPADRQAPLQSLLEPRSVAVVGASQDPTRIGGRVLSYLMKGGYDGRIVPVNANRPQVQGLAAYPDIGAVPGDVEAAILALPAEHTIEAVRACAARGVRACIVFSSGFSEVGEAGNAAQLELTRIARDSGMRILGPNCLGLFTAHTGFYGSFSNTLDRALPVPGPLSIVSQSGAFGTHLYYVARERGIGLRHWISTGNEADVQASECLSVVVDDPGTRVVLLYLEGVRDGRMLVEALDKARRAGKPVVVVKVGRSDVGAAAAASHTAALAGSDAVYDAVFREHGAWRAESAEEAVDIAYAAAKGIYPSGKRLGIVTISGGGGILMADVASSYGLDVAPMPEEAQRRLIATLPYAAPRNPVDMTAQAFNRMDLFAESLDLVVSHGGYDAVVAFLTTVPGSAPIRPQLGAALRSLRSRHPERLIVLSMAVPDDVRADYEAVGFPIFEDANRAIRAVAALNWFADAFARTSKPAADAGPVAIPEIPASAGEKEALSFLSACGVDVVAHRLCRSAEEARHAFREIGGPVVMKVSSPDIPHKTEVGGVIVGVESEERAATCHDELIRRVRLRMPQARIDGVLVASMVKDGLEVILGVRRDPVFGPAVVVGLGGIHAEIFRDTQLAVAPVDTDQALAAIRRLRSYPLLARARGQEHRDVDALAAMMVRLSRIALAAGNGLQSLDINPVAVLGEGRGCVVLDAGLFGSQPDAWSKDAGGEPAHLLKEGRY